MQVILEREWINNTVLLYSMGFPYSSVGKKFACNAGDPGSIPTGEGIGYPLQYSGPENSINRIVHGVAESRRRLSDLHRELYSIS